MKNISIITCGIWIASNLIFLFLAGDLVFDVEYLYPFDGIEYTSDYGIFDFLVYTLPVMVFCGYYNNFTLFSVS